MTNEIQQSNKINSLPFNNSSMSEQARLSPCQLLAGKNQAMFVHVMCEQSRRQVDCVYHIMTDSFKVQRQSLYLVLVLQNSGKRCQTQ